MADSLIVAADFGGSGLKAFFATSGIVPQLFLMEPEVALVLQQSLSVYEDNKTGVTPIANEAWVEYQGECHAVGFLARSRFKASMQLQKRKFELAIPKTLAMIGALSSLNNLPNGTDINLAVVLPWSEYQDRSEFQEIITSALCNFQFRGEPKSLNLNSFLCLPEGGGLMQKAARQNSNHSNHTQALLMIGYRDVSLMIAERGTVTKGVASKLGFSEMIRGVTNRVSAIDEQLLTKVISKAGKNVSPKALMSLVENLGDNYRDKELAKIRQAIISAREEYWLLLSQWLKLEIQSNVDEIILGGGTAYYFRESLNRLFSGIKINWGEDLEKNLQQNYPDVMSTNALEYRLTDVYGLFFFFWGTLYRTQALSK